MSATSFSTVSGGSYSTSINVSKGGGFEIPSPSGSALGSNSAGCKDSRVSTNIFELGNWGSEFWARGTVELTVVELERDRTNACAENRTSRGGTLVLLLRSMLQLRVDQILYDFLSLRFVRKEISSLDSL